MGWTITHALDRFTAEAGAFVAARPVENSVPRTVCGALRRRGTDAYGAEPPLFGRWRPAGAVTVSRVAAEAGDVLLSADLADPVAGGRYRRLGHVPVRDHVSIDFSGPESDVAA
ncbi:MULTISPECIES: hypothetical protein [unclassified Streptomyces]|uniref:hypothetical protein n=1 Tax=unclassified Streptomyces TaxID=2593676 RepID=UPI002E2BBE67|nr:hypothetical protein [Streptomyces sp. NBC_00223]